MDNQIIKIQIKTFFGKLLFEYEAENNTVKKTVEEAHKTGANLRGANLRGADLRGADLRGADLYGADLYGADLYGADLGGANLRWADLRGADLRGADLYGANLRGADLRGADLRGADLRGADLYGADLRGADLYGADNIISFGPIGECKRIIYAVKHDKKVMFQVGCHWGDAEQTGEAVREKYGEDSAYYKAIILLYETLAPAKKEVLTEKEA